MATPSYETISTSVGFDAAAFDVFRASVRFARMVAPRVAERRPLSNGANPAYIAMSYRDDDALHVLSANRDDTHYYDGVTRQAQIPLTLPGTQFGSEHPVLQRAKNQQFSISAINLNSKRVLVAREHVIHGPSDEEALANVAFIMHGGWQPQNVDVVIADAQAGDDPRAFLLPELIRLPMPGARRR